MVKIIIQKNKRSKIKVNLQPFYAGNSLQQHAHKQQHRVPNSTPHFPALLLLLLMLVL